MRDRLNTIVPLAAGATAGALLRHRITARSPSAAVAMRKVALVNIARSFMLGATHALTARAVLSKQWALALGPGFCGAFTTFSTLAAQLLHTYNAAPAAAATARAALHAASTCVLGVAAVAAGRFVALRIF